MPEKGWYSISVREKTANTIREKAKALKMTIDVYLNHLMTAPHTAKKQTGFVTCELCGARLKPENLSSHTSRVHPEHFFKKAY